MTDDNRHLRVVPDVPEIKCMYGTGDHGPCGGPLTQKGDGFDYCMNHGSIRMGQVLDPEYLRGLTGDLTFEDEE